MAQRGPTGEPLDSIDMETAEILSTVSSPKHVVTAILEARRQRFHHKVLNVRPDSGDERDQIYQPTLVEVKNFLDPPGVFVPDVDEDNAERRIRRRLKLIRNQGAEGSCTGQATANVVDIQNLFRITGHRKLRLRALRSEGSQSDFDRWCERRVSSRMLYESARALDDDPEDRLPGSTIRNALKGFSRNGVCREVSAPYEDGEPAWRLTLECVKEARQNGLGAYMRLRPIIYDYHAALNEVGAVLVSAMIHDGWDLKVNSPPVVASASQLPLRPIDYDPEGSLRGGHAFAIVGYTQAGFIVLNSWGRGWGTWKDTMDGPTQGLPGLALWTYDDWQDNVLDAWVFRLAASSEIAFNLRGGFGHGLNPLTGRKDRTVPRIAVNGHYLNLRNGRLVTTGAFPNNADTFEVTRRFLRDRLREQASGELAPGEPRYEHLLFGIGNGLTTIREGVRHAATTVPVMKRYGIYPLYVFWNHGLISQIEHLIDAALPGIDARAGPAEGLRNRLIERHLTEYGKFFTDRLGAELDVSGGRRQAKLAALKELELFRALFPLVELCRDNPQLKLHFVAHSDGVVLLNRILRALRLCLADEGPSLDEICRTIALITPLSLRREIPEVETIARNWREKQIGREVLLATLRWTDEDGESIGGYKGTFARLIQNVYFSSWRRDKDFEIMGLHRTAERLDRSPYYRHLTYDDTSLKSTRGHFSVIYNPFVMNEILSYVLDSGPSAGAQRGAELMADLSQIKSQ